MALRALTAPRSAFYGLNEVYTSPNGPPQADVILLHGLNGAPQKTWTEPVSKVFWPSQLLPQIFEKNSLRVRILVYGYDAKVYAFRGDVVTKDGIVQHAETFLSFLVSDRTTAGTTRRPIILLGHSLGGIVIKAAMNIAFEAYTAGKPSDNREIYLSTYGIIFAGTPHLGSAVARTASRFERWRERWIPGYVMNTSPQLLEALQLEADILSRINNRFMDFHTKFKLYYFWETLPMPMPLGEYVVDQASAAPSTIENVGRAGLPGNHSSMIKFDSPENPGFKLLSTQIYIFARDSVEGIPKLWAIEDQLVASASQSSSAILPSDRRHSNASTQTEKDIPAQILFTPPQMRRNNLFVDRQHELAEIDRKLFDGRDNIGTSTILIRGQAGVGKSHLARQYVYQNLQKFPSGIFWIHSKLEEEVCKAFWDISQKYVCRPELAPSDPSVSFIDKVRIWFESFSGWLLVFDGLEFENDEDIEKFKQYVPDSRKSYIIFVSRSTKLRFAQRLLHPEEVIVDSLKTEDGRTLLLEELDIKNPSQIQLLAAKELVRKVGGLPLAIHAISHRINDSHVRLQDYKLTSYSSLTRIASTYTAIFDDLYRNNHKEAINLANIICFFASQIPVGLLRLGEKGLANVEIKSPSGPNDRGPLELDNTLTLLRNHALIERNDLDESSGLSTTTSHSSSSNQDKSPRASGDIIVMHSVVRDYCCDRLNEANSIALWMTYAVRMFEEAYKVARLRMKAKTAPARLSDYHEFLVHGQQLQENLKKYNKIRKHDAELESLKTSLKPVVDDIKQEIKTREPGSSSDSIANVEFQPTVFEEPNSSSGSGDSASPRTSEDSGNDLSFVSTPSGSPLERRSPTDYYSAGQPYREKDFYRPEYFLNTSRGQLAAPYTDSTTVITPATPAGNGPSQWSAQQSLERLRLQSGLLNLPPPRLRERPPSMARTEPVVDTDVSPRTSPQLSYAQMVQQYAPYDTRPYSISYSQAPPMAVLDRQSTDPFRPESVDTSQRSEILRNASYFSNPNLVRKGTRDSSGLQRVEPRPILDPRVAPFVPGVGVVGSAPAFTQPRPPWDHPPSTEDLPIDPTTFPLSREQSHGTMSPARSAVILHNPPTSGQHVPRAFTPQGSEGRSMQHTRAQSIASIDSHMQWPTLEESMHLSRHSDQHEPVFEFEPHHESGYHSEAMSRTQSGQSALQAQDMSRSQSGPAAAIQYGALPPIDTRVARQRAFDAAHLRESLVMHHNTSHPSSLSQSRSSSQNPNMRRPPLSTATSSQAWPPLSTATNSQPWGSASTPAVIQNPSSRLRTESDASILPNLDGRGLNQYGQPQNNQKKEHRMSRSEM